MHYSACLRMFAGCAFAATFLSAASQQNPSLNPTPPIAALPMGRPVITPELRGDVYMARKMYREAIDMYRMEPDTSPKIENKIGIAFHQLADLNLAKKYYARAVHLDPHYAEAINNLGTVYYADKSYKKAIVYYKRSLRYWQPSACVYVNLGAAYFARHDYKSASENYERALDIDPDVFERRNAFGTLMQERASGEMAAFHLYLAKTYAKRGINDRALMYLRKALEEGIAQRDKLTEIPEFAQLKKGPEFQQLLLENPKPL